MSCTRNNLMKGWVFLGHPAKKGGKDEVSKAWNSRVKEEEDEARVSFTLYSLLQRWGNRYKDGEEDSLICTWHTGLELAMSLVHDLQKVKYNQLIIFIYMPNISARSFFTITLFLTQLEEADMVFLESEFLQIHSPQSIFLLLCPYLTSNISKYIIQTLITFSSSSYFLFPLIL